MIEHWMRYGSACRKLEDGEDLSRAEWKAIAYVEWKVIAYVAMPLYLALFAAWMLWGGR